MTRVVALTGNVAAGKSAVARLFADWGATVLSADRIVRELQQPGTPVFARIVARFGAEVVTPDGALDRTALRRMILADPVARHDLEQIVHPAVAERRDALVRAARERGDRLVVIEIPLLFEADQPSRYDRVVLVDAPVAVRRERLVRERGLTTEQADRLITSQLPTGPKRYASHHVIDNDGDLDALTAAARAVWDQLLPR